MADTTRSDGTMLPNPWSGPAGWWTLMAAGDGLRTCVDACAEWQQEVARFADTRFAENRKSLAAALEARDLTGLLRVQGEWGLKAAADYADEAVRLGRLAVALSLTGTTPAVQKTAMIVG